MGNDGGETGAQLAQLSLVLQRAAHGFLCPKLFGPVGDGGNDAGILFTRHPGQMDGAGDVPPVSAAVDPIEAGLLTT